MTELNGDYRAEGPSAVFGFRAENGRVVECAPYGRRWLMGKYTEEALAILVSKGFSVTRVGGGGEGGWEVESENLIGYEHNERAMRFGFLLSEIELLARALLDGRADDALGILTLVGMHVDEAKSIATEVSIEALDEAARGEG